MLKTHLYGAFHVQRPAWAVMKEQRYGRIVNTSSATALGVVDSWDYPAAKGGLMSLTRSLALTGERHDIKVNAIYAGNYNDARIKALAALKSGQPAQLSVMFSIDVYELIEQDGLYARMYRRHQLEMALEGS